MVATIVDVVSNENLESLSYGGDVVSVDVHYLHSSYLVSFLWVSPSHQTLYFVHYYYLHYCTSNCCDYYCSDLDF